MPTVFAMARGLLLCAVLAPVIKAFNGVEFCQTEKEKNCGPATDPNDHKKCITYSNAQSLYIGNGDYSGLTFPVLIGYSDANCKTETGCNTIGDNMGGVQNVDFDKNPAFKWALTAKSFRFDKECPKTCDGTCPPSDFQARDVNDTSAAQSEENHIVEERQNGASWRLCDDDNCSVNCGKYTDINGANCFGDSTGRKSAYFKGSGGSKSTLAGYDNNDCFGKPALQITANNGCNKLPSQHQSWQTTGVSK